MSEENQKDSYKESAEIKNWRLNKDVEPEQIEGYKWIFSEKAGWRKYKKSDTPDDPKPKKEKKPKITYLIESDSEEEEEYIVIPKKHKQPRYIYQERDEPNKTSNEDEEENYWSNYKSSLLGTFGKENQQKKQYTEEKINYGGYY